MKRFVSIALVLMMVFALAVSVSAAENESPKQVYVMTAEAVGDGTATANPTEVEVDENGVGKENVTFTATEAGGKFQKWELFCEYDIVSGGLDEKVLVVTPKSDIRAVAYFTGDSGDSTATKDDSNKAPKTGYPLFIVFAVMGMALVGGVVATKKIKE